MSSLVLPLAMSPRLIPVSLVAGRFGPKTARAMSTTSFATSPASLASIMRDAEMSSQPLARLKRPCSVKPGQAALRLLARVQGILFPMALTSSDIMDHRVQPACCATMVQSSGHPLP